MSEQDRAPKLGRADGLRADGLRADGLQAGEPGAKVHVVGPVFLDLVFSGLAVAPRPGAEVRSEELGISPGGVANMAVALARLGTDVALSSVFAEDAFGQYLWSTLVDEGIDLTWSARVADWHTPVTTSFAVARERGMVTYEEPSPLDPADLLPQGYRARAIVLSLSGTDAARLGRMRQVAPMVFADIGWEDEGQGRPDLGACLAEVDVFLPNAAEAMAYSRTASVEEAAARLAGDGPLVVVKDGANGSLALGPGMAGPVRAAAVKVDARDTTGAGDVFDAGFVYATLAGWPLAQRLRFANLCAAESVKLVGGSLSAPCWRDLAAAWASLDGPEVRDSYRFLDEVMVEAKRGWTCRRSCASLVGSLAALPSQERDQQDH